MKRWVPACLVALALCSVHCGGASGPQEKLVPVSGIVKIGGTPTQGVRIVFQPASNAKGLGSYAVTDAEGKYLLVDRDQRPGVPAGQYSVHLSLYKQPNGAPVPEGKSPVESNTRESLPRMWSDFGVVGAHNSVTVPEAGKSFDFDIPKS